MPSLSSLTLTQMQAGLQRGDFSSRELVQSTLDEIARLDRKALDELVATLANASGRLKG